MCVVRESTHLKIMQNDGLNTTVKRRSEVTLVSRSPDVGMRKLQPKPARISYPCVDTQAHWEQVRRAHQVSLLSLDRDGLQIGCTFSPSLAPTFYRSCRWIVVSGRAVNLTIETYNPSSPGRLLGYSNFSRRKRMIPQQTLFRLALKPSVHQKGRIGLRLGLYE